MGRIAGLDELRGIAIILVMLGHWLPRFPAFNPQSPRWGTVIAVAAVDLFFIISGFLITGILLRSKGSPAYFQHFYIRRIARILPLALIVIAISYVVFAETRYLLPGYLFFYNNYQLVAVGKPMTGLGPMWSLAVEEQFYALWPVVIWLVPKRWVWLAVLIACGILFLHPLSIPSNAIFIVDRMYLTDGRTDLRALPIALGAYLAVWHAGLLPRPRLVTTGLLMGIVGSLILTGKTNGLLTYPVIALQTVVVGLTVSGRAVLAVPALRWLGVRCYGLYLLHQFALLAMSGRIVRQPLFIDLAVYFGTCAMLAGLSFRFFEQPLINLARRYTDRLQEHVHTITSISHEAPTWYPLALDLTPAQWVWVCDRARALEITPHTIVKQLIDKARNTTGDGPAVTRDDAHLSEDVPVSVPSGAK